MSAPKGSYEAVFGHMGMTPDELGNLWFQREDALAAALVILNETRNDNSRLTDVVLRLQKELGQCEAQRATLADALRVCVAALDEASDNVNPERGYAAELEATIEIAKGQGILALAKLT